jgi:hypothetical protein
MKKITAKNLMIGDWVKYKGHEVQVKQIWHNILDELVIECGAVDSTKSATPIPITDELLKLNGFELAPLTGKVVYGKSISKDCTIFHMSDGNSNSLYVTLYKKDTADVVCQTSVVNAKYIHQLQQAYRLATGKELKVKF